MKIKDVMSKEPAFCAPDTKLDAVAKLMLDRSCGAIPILDHGNLAGIVTDRDIACRTVAAGKNPLDVKARDIMTKVVYTIGENENVDTALVQMQEQHVRRLPVMRDGRMTGIISIADLVSYLPSPKVAQLMTAVSTPVIEVAVPAP